MSFSFSQFKDAEDFLLKHPDMNPENAIEFLDHELKKIEKVT